MSITSGSCPTALAPFMTLASTCPAESLRSCCSSLGWRFLPAELRAVSNDACPCADAASRWSAVPPLRHIRKIRLNHGPPSLLRCRHGLHLAVFYAVEEINNQPDN